VILKGELDVAVKNELDILKVSWGHDINSVGEEILAVPVVEEVLNSACCGNDRLVNSEFAFHKAVTQREDSDNATNHKSEDPSKKVSDHSS